MIHMITILNMIGIIETKPQTCWLPEHSLHQFYRVCKENRETPQTKTGFEEKIDPLAAQGVSLLQLLVAHPARHPSGVLPSIQQTWKWNVAP